jgi:parallel beta-helix repeat protein
MGFRIKYLSAIFLLIAFVLFSTQVSAASYSYSQVNAGGNTEYRLYNGSQHFMTAILTSQGAISLRPHPGVDVNGWGSSLYLQPFLPGATLKYTNIRSVSANESGIRIIADGNVSKGTVENYGYWKSDIFYSYNQELKEIKGSGNYTVNLIGALSAATGDLNIYKLASNYLKNVPLLNDGLGDTGDMYEAIVIGNKSYPGFTWDPVAFPAHFPGYYTQNISIDASGNLYNVNTSAQGYSAIAAAYKPSMKVVLNSRDSGIRMMFGGIYDLTKSQDFWEDNIGITPLIQQPTTKTNYTFDVIFYSKARAGDGFMPWSNRSVQLINGKVRVNGAEFIMKGMAYAPWITGTGPEPSYNPFPNETVDVTNLVNNNGEIYVQDYNGNGRIEAGEVIQHDLDTMKAQGVNTIRIYASGIWHDRNLNGIQDYGETVNGDLPDWVIDKLLNYSNANGMKVIIGYWVGDEDLIGSPMVCNWTDLEVAKRTFGRIVAKYKDNPAVLGWGIGNEVHGSWNMGWFNWGVDINDYLNKLFAYVRTVDGGNRPIIYTKYVGENSSFNKIDVEIIAINAGTNTAASISGAGEFAIKTQQGRAYMIGEYGDILSYSDSLWNLSKQYAGGAFLEYNNVWWKTGGDSFGTVTMYRENKADRYGKVLYLYKNQTAACYANSGCGNNTWLNAFSCNGTKAWDVYRTYTCNNPATPSASCSHTDNSAMRINCAVNCYEGSCINDSASLLMYEYFDSVDEININGGDVLAQNMYSPGIMSFVRNNCGLAGNLVSGAYIEYPLAGRFPSSGEFTVDFMMKQQDVDTSYGLWGIGPLSGAKNSIGFFINGRSLYIEVRNDSNGGLQDSSGYPINNSIWNHIAVVFKNSTLSGCLDIYSYVNGKKDSHGRVCGFKPNMSEVMMVGRSGFYGSSYSWMDEFKIYSYALSDVEVNNSYKSMLTCTSNYTTPETIACSTNSQCGANGYVGSPSCSANDSYQNYITYTCNNANTTSSYCSNNTVLQLKQDCGDTSYGNWSANTCDGNNVTKTRTVYNKGCNVGLCTSSNSTEKQIVQTCSYGCTSGSCNSAPVNSSNCTVPYDRMNITNNTIFCRGDYYLPNGIIIVGTPSLNCNGSTLNGNGTGIGIDDNGYNYRQTIQNCIIKNYSTGYESGSGTYGTLINNQALNNGYGFSFYNTHSITLTNNTAKDNKFGGFYFDNADGMVLIANKLYNNPTGITFYYESDNNYLENNTISNSTTFGIYVVNSASTRYNRFRNNSLTNSGYAFYSSGESYGDYSNNTVSNSNYGFYFTSSFQNNIEGNRIINNSYGVVITGINNTVYHNNFIGNRNSSQASGANNSFNKSSQGNYWSDYDEQSEGCQDLNGDGRCDAPKNISGTGNSKDYYPFTTQNGWTNITVPVINCSTNLQCGTSGFIGSPGCSANDSYQNYNTYTCNNPGTVSSYCSNSSALQLKQDCGDTSYGNWSANTCDGNNVTKTRTVYNKGCNVGLCTSSNSTEKQIVQTCSYGCSNGTCNGAPAACYQDSDCGIDYWWNNNYCSGGNVWDTRTIFLCSNPGPGSTCLFAEPNRTKQNCSYGCSSGSCNNITINPVVISITSPTSASTYSSSTTSIFNISGTVSGGNGGISRIVLTSSLGEIKNCSLITNSTWRCENMELISGANSLTVRAYDGLGNSSSDNLVITFTSAYPQLDESAMRAGMGLIDVDMDDNLVPGDNITVRWKILSYYPLISSMKVTLPTNQTVNINGRRVGVEPGRWKIYDRNSKVFVFETNWVVPQVAGDSRVRFAAALEDGYAYMNANVPGGVDSRPYLTDGKEILRTIVSGGTNRGIFTENTTVVPPYFDTLDKSILRAGGTITRINMSDNLVPGTTVTIRYDVLSYVPILSRFKVKTASGADIQAETVLVNTTDGRWSIYTYRSKVYTFEYNWTIPSDSGDARIRFMNAQSDGYAYMNGNIPGGVDSRPYLSEGKEVLRTIV